MTTSQDFQKHFNTWRYMMGPTIAHRRDNLAPLAAPPSTQQTSHLFKTFFNNWRASMGELLDERLDISDPTPPLQQMHITTTPPQPAPHILDDISSETKAVHHPRSEQTRTTQNPDDNINTPPPDSYYELPTSSKIWTATPPEDWPFIHINDPLGVLRHVRHDGVSSILNDSTNLVMIHIWDAPLPSQISNLITALLKGLQRLLLPVEQPTIHIPPTAHSTSLHPHYHKPTVLGISNLSTEAREFLLEQKVFSLKDPRLTFFTHRPAISTPSFITMLTGFSDLRDMDTVRISIVNTLLRCPTVSSLITAMTEHHPSYQHLRTVEALQAVVQTTQITLLSMFTPRGDNVSQVCLYMDVPTQDTHAWCSLHDAIRGLIFQGPLNKLCIAKELPTPCSGCGALDHPRPICPFHTVPDWNGTTSHNQLRAMDSAATNLSKQQKRKHKTNKHYETIDLFPVGPYNPPQPFRKHVTITPL
ncbi:hypothetical protein BC835DRAFT_1304529 [Cytidiella melzeri]|nr:hypothetical protein BC835DRAFT_1304529 [Cytidiella melzeri]